MKINTKQLQDALSIVKPGLANKEILDQTTSFAFTDGRIVTYNDEISISHPFETEFEGAVKAEELYGLLGRIEKDEVSIVMQETELLISSGRVKAGLRLETEIRLPLKELPKKMEKLSHPRQFRGFVGMAMQTCSNDTSQPRLTCVYIREDGVITGSDGYRLVRCKGAPLPIKSFLLPARNAVEVVKLQPVEVALEKGWVHFRNKEGSVISCRKMDDDYVPEDQIEEVLRLEKAGKVEFPERIDRMLDRVHQFAKRDSFLEEIIMVEVDGGKITLKAATAETGSWIEERSTIETDKSFKFVVTPSLFREVTNITRTAVFDKSMRKIKFEGEDWKYVLMLRDPETNSK